MKVFGAVLFAVGGVLLYYAIKHPQPPPPPGGAGKTSQSIGGSTWGQWSPLDASTWAPYAQQYITTHPAVQNPGYWYNVGTLRGNP